MIGCAFALRNASAITCLDTHSQSTLYPRSAGSQPSFPLLSVAGHNSPHATSQERTTECYRARPRLRPSPLPPASTNPPRPLAHSRSSSPYLTSSACPSILRRPACSRPSPFVRLCVCECVVISPSALPPPPSLSPIQSTRMRGYSSPLHRCRTAVTARTHPILTSKWAGIHAG